MSKSFRAQKTKVGLFGGSFDPIHYGHLIIAEWLLSELQLDRVVFIPVAYHPFKSKKNLSPSFHRFKMVQMAIQPFSYFEVSDYEIKQNKISYTIDTLRYFRQQLPQTSFYFFIGGDNLSEFTLWKDYQSLLELATFVVYSRAKETLPPELPAEKFVFAKAPLIEISSTLIRQRLKQGKPIQSLVPLEVWQYIQKHGLYR